MCIKVNNIDDLFFIFSFKEISKRIKVWKEALNTACKLFEHEYGCENCPLVMCCSDTHILIDEIDNTVYHEQRKKN